MLNEVIITSYFVSNIRFVFVDVKCHRIELDSLFIYDSFLYTMFDFLLSYAHAYFAVPPQMKKQTSQPSGGGNGEILHTHA